MKKIILTIMLLITTITLTSCKGAKGNMEFIKYNDYLNNDNPVVVIKVKDYGVMELQLFEEIAPISTQNFLDYVKDEAYTKSNFHRIIKNFMIQGGMVDNTNDSIKGEFLSNGVKNDIKHTKGVISMARTTVKDSATSQFFIVHKDSPHLDGDYAAFGGLIDGFDVLDEIANTKTDYMDAPYDNVVIESIKIK